MPVRCSVSEFSNILQSKVSAAITYTRLSEGICRHFYVLNLTWKVPSLFSRHYCRIMGFLWHAAVLFFPYCPSSPQTRAALQSCRHVRMKIQ